MDGVVPTSSWKTKILFQEKFSTKKARCSAASFVRRSSGLRHGWASGLWLLRIRITPIPHPLAEIGRIAAKSPVIRYIPPEKCGLGIWLQRKKKLLAFSFYLKNQNFVA